MNKEDDDVIEQPLALSYVSNTAICCHLIYVQLRVLCIRDMMIVPSFLWEWSDNPTLFFFNCNRKTSCHHLYMLLVVDSLSHLINPWLSCVQLKVMWKLLQFFLLISCYTFSYLYAICRSKLIVSGAYEQRRWWCNIATISHSTISPILPFFAG